MTRQADALLVIMVSFMLAFWLRFGYAPLPQNYLIALLVTLLLSSIVLPTTGAFRKEFEWALMQVKLRPGLISVKSGPDYMQFIFYSSILIPYLYAGYKYR